MSNATFPTLAGIMWNVARVPQFNTKIQKAVSGREIRLAMMAAPMYTFKMSYEVLRQDTLFAELQTLGGFFLARQGAYDSFLYTDPADNATTGATFGVGDGSTQGFQLVRTYGAGGNTFAEVVNNVSGTPTIYINGVATTAFTIDGNGFVTFTTAPASGAVLTWSGSYCYRVRFSADTLEFNQFMRNLFELKKCELFGSLANKV